jgi:hypothetical protein
MERTYNSAKTILLDHIAYILDSRDLDTNAQAAERICFIRSNFYRFAWDCNSAESDLCKHKRHVNAKLY